MTDAAAKVRIASTIVKTPAATATHMNQVDNARFIMQRGFDTKWPPFCKLIRGMRVTGC
jgi:hypothetical protein